MGKKGGFLYFPSGGVSDLIYNRSHASCTECVFSLFWKVLLIGRHVLLLCATSDETLSLMGLEVWF